jgi:hypothetical protein
MVFMKKNKIVGGITDIDKEKSDASALKVSTDKIENKYASAEFNFDVKTDF